MALIKIHPQLLLVPRPIIHVSPELLVAGVQFSSYVLHKKIMLINVSSWDGLYKPLFAWESSPKLLNPGVGEFIFINPLAEGTA